VTLATETMLPARCDAMASAACFIPSAVPTGFVYGILKGTPASIRRSRTTRHRASCCCWSSLSRGWLLAAQLPPALCVPRRHALGEGTAGARLHLARTPHWHAIRGAGPRAPRSPWSTSLRRGPSLALSWPAPYSQARYKRALAAQRRTYSSSSSSRPGFAAQR
jgi:hypothetical protein